MKITELIDRLAAKLPKNLHGALMSHVKVLRELIEGELEAARKSPDKVAKLAVTKKIVTTCAAVCTTVGVEPIPLADFPILTSLQISMVAAIIHISGRELGRKMAVEFIAALGANIGAGLALREGARALLKLFPGWGNAISGAIAGAGTYAIGKAAKLYFIDGGSLNEARQLVRRAKEELPL